ncbi:S41 family peptidase [Desertibacillus haloalkaliphilus]|uniref:S41 family peptidase n=1 Tax=Desertibacillus haloalkaliphilus TaxID=1328930 RepID=UPI001C25F587|nr:S41 family peptidase [Desertibacillus haloalkaliphilus]MBU8908687.1 S41 family peptidase [Desertibacillus haloalkaliphilus]
MNERGKLLALAVIVSLLIGAGGMYAGMSVFTDQPDDAVAEGSAPLFPAPGEGVELSEEALVKFGKAYQLINERYVEAVDEEMLLEGAIEGMLGTLEDPYSVYMDRETAQQFMESLDSHFEGIGAEVSMTNGNVTIVAPFRDSPAEKAGLQPNDQILEIDGESIEGLSLYEAVLQIRGEKGSIVNLTIDRQGVNDPIQIDVERDEIPYETVYTDLIEHQGQKVGVIEITSFSEDTSKDFAAGLNQLEEQGIDGLIIDVRGNPGGYLNSVDEIGNLVIPNNEPIVQIQDRSGERVRYLSSLEEAKPYPIIGVIDRGSASASEILAGALKEAGGYDLVGETTFGKGTVQQAIQLGDGSEIKLSLFKWLTSAGNSINEVGVDPTIEVEQPAYFYLSPLHVEDDEMLEYDMINQQIANAQEMLKGLGLEPGRTDGYFSSQTEAAVKAFQETQGLEVTGKIGAETASALHQQILEEVRDEANDRQLNTAIELLLQQISND